MNRCARAGKGASSLGRPASGGRPDWMKSPALERRLRHLPLRYVREALECLEFAAV